MARRPITYHQASSTEDHQDMATQGVEEKRAPFATQVFYETSGRQLSDQLQAIDSIDAKAATMTVFASGILGLFVALLGLQSPHPSNSLYAFLTGAMLVYVVLVILTLFGYRIRQDWEGGPKSDYLEEFCGTHDEDAAKVWVGQGYVDSLATNDKRMGEKGRWLVVAMCLLPVEVLLLAGAGISAIAAR